MIAQYLSELLFRFDTVVLPGLGTFQLKSVPATMSGNTIIPPGKILLFNSSLNVNDGVLANYISEKDRISFFDACSQIQDYVAAIHKNLDEGKDITLEKIGRLKKDNSGNLCFTADSGDAYNIDSFGLGSVTAIPLAEEKIIEKLNSTKRNSRTIIWIASVLFLLIAGFTIVYLLMPDLFRKSKPVSVAQKQNITIKFSDKNNHEQLSENKDTTVMNKDTIKQGTQINNSEISQTGIKYYIIAASFRIKENADNYVIQLNGKGHKSESIYLPERNLYVVSYDAYTDKTQAEQVLATINTSQNSAAWILEK